MSQGISQSAYSGWVFVHFDPTYNTGLSIGGQAKTAGATIYQFVDLTGFNFATYLIPNDITIPFVRVPTGMLNNYYGITTTPPPFMATKPGYFDIAKLPVLPPKPLPPVTAPPPPPIVQPPTTGPLPVEATPIKPTISDTLRALARLHDSLADSFQGR